MRDAKPYTRVYIGVEIKVVTDVKLGCQTAGDCFISLVLPKLYGCQAEIARDAQAGDSVVLHRL